MNVVLKTAGYTGRPDIYTLNTHLNPAERQKSVFCQESYEQKGLCVWLAMCAAMNIRFPVLATAMLEKMTHFPYLFQWLTVKGHKMFYDGKHLEKGEDLLEVLSSKPDPTKLLGSASGTYLFSCFFYPNEFNHSFRKLKSREAELYQGVEKLEKQKGIIVAFLSQSTREISSHAIAIDCDKQRIYDSESKCVMKMNRDALDLCTGDQPFVRFSAIYKLYDYIDSNKTYKKPIYSWATNIK